MRYFKIEQYRFDPRTDDLAWLPAPDHVEPYSDLHEALEYAESIPDLLPHTPKHVSWHWTMAKDAFYSNKLIRIKFYENNKS